MYDESDFITDILVLIAFLFLLLNIWKDTGNMIINLDDSSIIVRFVISFIFSLILTIALSICRQEKIKFLLNNEEDNDEE